MRSIVVGITGASGAIYASRLLNVLAAAGRDVHVTISSSAVQVIRQELGVVIDLKKVDLVKQFLGDPKIVTADSKLLSVRRQSAIPQNSSIFSDTQTPAGKLVYHHYQNYNSGIASGSFLTEGMVICPCSMSTLAAIATGQAANLLQRAAEVHLKERRKLILVPRETPLSSISLDNMKRLADAGAIILPAMPGFYHNPTQMMDLVDFVVARICDQLGVAHDLVQRWGRKAAARSGKSSGGSSVNRHDDVM